MSQLDDGQNPPKYDEGQGLGPLHQIGEGAGPGLGEVGGEGSGGIGGGGQGGDGGSEASGSSPTVRRPHEMLDRRVVTYWLLAGLLSLIVPFAIIGGGTLWATSYFDKYGTLIVTMAGLFAAFLLGVAVISPPLAYNRWRFSVDDELLLARYGIIWIEEKSIPISRLQHVDLQRGPIERLFGLTTLVVFTAGTEGAHFRLPGLAHPRAQELRDQILAARGDDVI